MPTRNKDGLYEFNGSMWEYTWIYQGVRKYANFNHRTGELIVTK